MIAKRLPKKLKEWKTKGVKANTEALMKVFKFMNSDVDLNEDSLKEVWKYLQVDQTTQWMWRFSKMRDFYRFSNLSRMQCLNEEGKPLKLLVRDDQNNFFWWIFSIVGFIKWCFIVELRKGEWEFWMIIEISSFLGIVNLANLLGVFCCGKAE